MTAPATRATTSRTAVITGGASGIGLGCAQHLAAAGHRVGLVDVQGEVAEQAAKELRDRGVEAVAHQADVADRAAVRRAIDGVRDQLGPITIIVTSAGIERYGPTVDISDEDWDHVVAVNLTGTFVAVQAVIPDMIEAGWGRIVTISSMSAQTGAPNMAHYVASKGGVIALTKSLSTDLAPQGITVNTIPPSIVDTPMARQGEASGNFLTVDQVAGMTPVRRAGTVDDIAGMVGYLCSEQGGFITGQQINVNGGWYM